jgi:uncharacterized protein YjbI with pentapeptide repeats
VKFKGCKLLGLLFETCNQFGLGFEFENCQLNNSVFYKTKIKSTKFSNCSLREVDFSLTDLTGSKFENCDLLNCTFDGTNLEKVDLSTSFNYSIDADQNQIKKSIHSVKGALGLLNKYDISVI